VLVGKQEAIHDDFPMLGVRMLCPRYDVGTAIMNLARLASLNNFISVPRLPNEWTKFMLTLDFKRTDCEPRDAINCFIDVKVGGDYKYKMVRANLKPFYELHNLLIHF
jgi:hypothetical protein